MHNQAASLKVILDSAIIARANRPMRLAWAEEFNLENNDLPSIFFILSEIVKSLREIRAKVQSINTVNPEIICKPLEILENAICFPNLEAGMNSIQGVYGDRAQMALELASSYFDNSKIEQSISKDDLAEIQKQLDDLFQFTITAEISQDLRSIILDLLETIRRAVSEYRIRGNSSLRRVLDESLGRLMREYNSTSSNEQDGQAIRRLGALLSIIDKAISVAKNAKPILEYMTTFIPYITSSN